MKGKTFGKSRAYEGKEVLKVSFSAKSPARDIA